MSQDDTREKLEWRKSKFECELKNTYGIENQNYMTRIHYNKVKNIEGMQFTTWYNKSS